MLFECSVQKRAKIVGNTIMDDCRRGHHDRNTANQLPSLSIRATILKQATLAAGHYAGAGVF